MLIEREFRTIVRHFEIGDYIEYAWFRGFVVGINANSLSQKVRVVEVIRPAPSRNIGAICNVPFNLGRECERPERRNCEESQNV